MCLQHSVFLVLLSLYSSAPWQTAAPNTPTALGAARQLAASRHMFLFLRAHILHSASQPSHDAWQLLTATPLNPAVTQLAPINTISKYGPTVQPDACAKTKALSQLTQVMCRVQSGELVLSLLPALPTSPPRESKIHSFDCMATVHCSWQTKPGQEKGQH